MADLRAVLSKYRVEWKDSGKNCASGWVNIRCTFCRDDPSYHYRIAEDNGWGYCLRNATHRGSLYKLFQHLKIPARELPDVVNNAQKEYVEPVRRNFDYDKFTPAYESPECLDYLLFRKFQNPQEVIEKFNLRFAPVGKSAGRLLIPLTVGWTGRAMRPGLEPRYLAATDERGFFLGGRGKTGFLVEGPLDALKLLVAAPGFTVAAMTGLRLNTSMLIELRNRQLETLCLVTDADSSADVRFSFFVELQTAMPFTTIRNVYLPAGYKDPCAMDEYTALNWAYGLGV